MNISFIEPHLRIFGGIRRIIELSNRLVRRGHDVTIFHSDGSPCQWMEGVAKTRPAAEILTESHDVIIFNDNNPVDLRLAKESKARLKIFYVLELYEKRLLTGFKPQLYQKRFRRSFYMKKCLKTKYLKLTNSTWLQKWLEEKMGIKSILLLGGINTDMFYPVASPHPEDRFCILCSGDRRPRKGTRTIVEAVEIVKLEVPNVILDTYHGLGIPQSKMGAKYSSADLFVEASWQAGWNNPVAEAMACNVPVVCTDIGGVHDFAFHEETALLVPPKNPQKMAEAILTMVGNPELRTTLSGNAFKKICTFDWDESAAKLERIILSELKKIEE